MAAAEQSITIHEPLVGNSNNNNNHYPYSDGPNDAVLKKHLAKLETFLRIFGFCQYSFFSGLLSWLAYLVIAILLPLWTLYYAYCSNCEQYQIRTFELQIFASQALVAGISLLCISHNLRKHGIRKLLFVDRYHGMAQFTPQYLEKFKGFYRSLVTWVVVGFLLKAAREVVRAIYLHDELWWWSVAVLVVSLVSWTYSTILFLSGTALFNLVGNLQIIHFENYGKLLERDMDVSVYIEEHMRLTHYLSKISHRFRIFLLLEFLVVSASQFVALLQTTGNKGIINFLNGGDFLVLSIVELVGIVLCLNAAAKISHRAQAIGSVASRWHMLVTANSSDVSASFMSNGGNPDPLNTVGSLTVNYSESDLESTSDFIPLPATVQLTSQMTSFHKRQAFVTYVQSNTGGFSIFGWIIDRMLINTIFFIELSLVFFVLGKTITFTTR
ncbi:OLC1v1013601C1 [Oldenlandia corymbosa var. corymbosa]|uniref:OLC1v1013601C1 n=1 Tax=Oldenlandia corymbosa var. corymbosa TaxID=529605 RepID=A0AAV1E286_OLDCO|nr:OLC1v1013601C1 [Oldenlandia corymbosa var. corymbosa]